MADAPEVKVKLTAEDTGVSAAIKELSAQLKGLKKQQDDTAGSALNLSKAFDAIVASASVIGFARIGKEAFDSAVNIGKMADKTGITTQTLSVFHKVADDVGVSTEAVDKGLTKAAKSITEFEAGSTKAAKGFQILGLSQKDFAGLNSDQKIQLVTDRLGKMKAGFEKTTAAQLIFSRGGTETIPVLNALAAQGFDKATAATSKLGLLLDQTTTDTFREAKASIQQLTDVGTGMATQFEAGLLPAISDVGDALADSLTQGGVSFEDLGKYAGDAVRGIVLVFLGLGQTLGAVAESIAEIYVAAWHLIKNYAITDFNALSEAAHGHLGNAFKTLNSGAKQSTDIVTDEVGRQMAIYKTLGDSIKSDYANVFVSEEEEKRRAAARLAGLRPDKQDEQPGQLVENGPNDAAARAALALHEKKSQDELTIHRATAEQTAQIDKEEYDAGQISLAEYYDRRRIAIKKDTTEEVAILQQGLVAAQEAVQKAAEAKRTAANPKDKDKEQAEKLQALAQVDELQTKITELQISSGTKISALNDEQFKAQQESQEKTLDFEKELATLQGRRQESARADIEAEAQKRTLQIKQEGGPQAPKLMAELEQWKQLKLAVADFDDAQKKMEDDQKAFELAKQQIEIQAKAGKKSPLETEREINQLLTERLPLLQADAAAEAGAAKKTGNIDDIATAQNAVQGIQNLKASTASLGAQLGGPISQDFTSFFESIGKGTRSVADQFRGLAASVVASIEQMVVKMLLLKIATSSLGTGGGFFGSIFGAFGGSGHAEGGLIRGPGGPKSDSIPARVSPGEYIVKADAVSAFGVHNLEAINRGLKVPSLERLSLPKFAEGGLVGVGGSGPGDSNIHLGIGLEEGLVLKHLSSKAAGNIILQQLTNNPKAASKALSRSQ